MAFQFVHLESFSRKTDTSGRGTDFVFAEAARKPGACVHVRDSAPPIVVFGVGIQQVQEMHDAAADAARTTIEGGTLKKIRKDQKTLLTVVASHPSTMDEIRADPEKRKEAEAWEKRTIVWLRSLYGNDLASVIRHEDESHFHIHAYVVPTRDPEMKAMRHHPGTTAKRAMMAAGPAEGEDAKALHKRADAAYKQSMRAWQDSYYESVGIPCGLARLGPKRRRLTRAEWQREQAQAKALQKTVQQAKKLKASGDDFVARTKAEAEAIRNAAARDKEIAKKTTATALAVREQAHKAQEAAAEAIARSNRYSGIGGRLRALWDSLGESKLAAKLREEFATEIARVQAFARAVQDRLQVEEKRRHEAEKRAHEAAQDAERARDAALRMRIERDRAYAMLPPEQQQELVAAGPAMKMTLRPKQKNEGR